MSTKMIEQELAELKRRVDHLEKAAASTEKQSWRQAFGAMKDEPLLREAAKLGAEWRAMENQRT